MGIVVAFQAISPRGPTLADKTAFLSRPDAYPGPRAPVTVLETHNSVVFLNAERAWKLRKPVRRPYLDHEAPEARQFDSAEEVRLGQALAPGVHLGVHPLRQRPSGRLTLSAVGEPVDWLVEMRRLPREAMLDARLATGAVDRAAVAALAQALAQFHRTAPSARLDGAAYFWRLADGIRTNREALGRPTTGLPTEQVARIHDAQSRCLAENADVFAARAGLVVEGHGDLRPEHVLAGAEPLIIDRLSFDRALRHVDPIDDLARLAMECDQMGARWIGRHLYEGRARATGDRPAPRLVAFHKSWRAAQRARFLIWHLSDTPAETHAGWRARARAYLDLAEAYAPAMAGP